MNERALNNNNKQLKACRQCECWWSDESPGVEWFPTLIRHGEHFSANQYVLANRVGPIDVFVRYISYNDQPGRQVRVENSYLAFRE